MDKENREIGVHQFTLMVIFFGMGSSILIAPASLATIAKQDAWISAIIGTLMDLISVVVYAGLVRMYPRKSILEMNELAFGKWFGIAVSLLYVFFFFVLSYALLGDVGYFLTTQVMPETPIVFIMSCMMIVALMAVRLGPDVIARGSEVFFPWVMLLFFLLVIMLLPKTEIQKMQPIMEFGAVPAFRAAFPYGSLQEYVVLMMLLPYVKSSPKIRSSFFAGVIAAGAVVFVIMLLCIVVLGPGLTAVNLYPTLTLAKKISIGHFLERVEVIIGGMWLITITFKLIMTFFATAAGLTQIFRFKNYVFLTVPLAMLVVVFVMPSYTNIVVVVDFVDRVWPYFAWLFMFILPTAAWVALWVRRLAARGADDDSPQVESG